MNVTDGQTDGRTTCRGITALCVASRSKSGFKRMKDTVAADKKYDEVDADNCAESLDASIGLDAIVHDQVPIFTG